MEQGILLEKRARLPRCPCFNEGIPMTKEVLGMEVKLRLFAPGDDKFSAHATGIIVEYLPTEGAQAFHDGYRIKLDSPIVVEGIEIMALSICPSGSYPFEPGKNKILV